ncbi:hypothetical protein CCAND95_130016 [Capnocytophaga canis]|nr:hypothetical protein CCAND95_130016 [Capnocytophaga canis]
MLEMNQIVGILIKKVLPLPFSLST